MNNSIIYNTKTRLKICGFLCLVPALLVGVRLFYLQTFRHDEFAAKTEKSIYSYLAEDRIRGNILDVNGNLMAESLRTHSCAVLKKYVNDKDKALAVLSQTLEIPKKELQQKWNQSSNFFYVAKKIKPPAYAKLTSEIKENRLTGIELTPEYERIRPHGNLALDLIGVSNSKNYGLSGIEQLFNDDLSQDIGRKRAMRARRGQIIYERAMKEQENVSDIYLTIDTLAQYHVEEILKKYVDANEAQRGMAIVQDPNTGFIIAAASYPAKDGQSMPFQFTYEPGSTFKAITAAAALNSGIVTPQTQMNFEEENRWQVTPGFAVRDTGKTKAMTVGHMMDVSSNRGAARLALDLGAKDFFFYIKAFGFGTKTDIGFQGEAKGTVRDFNDWTKIDTATVGYGYGVSLTGVQLITAYSAIANGGYLMQPHIISEKKSTSGKVLSKAKIKKIRKVLEPQTAADMNEILKHVVSDGGAKRAAVPGYTVAGKTGTAEKSEQGSYAKKSHIVSFAGYLPASKPAFTILVVLDQPSKPIFGSQAAAPAFGEIGARLMSIYAVPKDAGAA